MGNTVKRAFTPPGTGGLEAQQEQAAADQQTAIDNANKAAELARQQTQAAIDALNAPKEQTPEEKKAAVAADLASKAAKSAQVATMQDQASLATDRLFRLFGARAAFAGNRVSPLV